MNRYDRCACHSKILYHKCCQPFHNGTATANALQLMRSRYCAYAIKLADYIIDTTHPDNIHYNKNHAAWKQELLGFSEQTKFDHLRILSFEDGEERAFVTFEASLRQQNQDASFTEKSEFQFDGRWLYKSGQMQGGSTPQN